MNAWQAANPESLIDDLQSRVSELEDALNLSWLPPVEFGLTVQQGRLLAVLVEHRQVSDKMGRVASLPVGKLTDDRVTDVHRTQLSFMRTKLEPFGLGIKTISGFGWRLDGPNSEYIRQWTSGTPWAPPAKEGVA